MNGGEEGAREGKKGNGVLKKGGGRWRHVRGAAARPLVGTAQASTAKMGGATAPRRSSSRRDRVWLLYVQGPAEGAAWKRFSLG